MGVFVDAPMEEIRRAVYLGGLKAVQLHGSEPPEAIDQLGVPVIKAFRIKGPDDLARLPDYRNAAGLLLDPYVEGQHGGTGQTLDWTWSAGRPRPWSGPAFRWRSPASRSPPGSPG